MITLQQQIAAQERFLINHPGEKKHGIADAILASLRELEAARAEIARMTAERKS